MKKYFFGFIAIAAAVTFCAFKKPMSSQQFQVTSDPTSASVVASAYNGINWVEAGKASSAEFGTCISSSQEDLACDIDLETATMSQYYHLDAGGYLILNTQKYAEDNYVSANPASGPKFLEITATSGGSGRFKVNTISAKQVRFISGAFQVQAASPSVNINKQQGTGGTLDVAYWNSDL